MGLDQKTRDAYLRLRPFRTRTDLKLRKLKFFKDTFTGFDEQEHPLVIRYYQVQAILHLISMHRFVLGEDCGLGKCVSGDTLVLTDRGLVPIADLRDRYEPLPEPGTFVKPEPRKVWTGSRWAPIRSFYYDGEKLTKKLTTRYGFTIEGSHRHPLWVRTEIGEQWRQLPSLVEGDFVCVERREVGWPEHEVPAVWHDLRPANAKRYRVPATVTPELGRLLGYYVSEGNGCRPDGFVITQHHPESHDDIRGLLKRCFGWEGNFNSKSASEEIFVSSVVLRDYLEQRGAKHVKSGEKRVPWDVHASPREVVKQFLRGLFEGDGCALVGSGIEYSSKSEMLCHEVQALLLRFGIVSNVSRKVVKGQDYWRLTLFDDDAREFFTKIGFVTVRKNLDLAGVLGKESNPNHDVIPFAGPSIAGLYRKLREATTVRGSNALKKGSGILQFGTGFCIAMREVIRGVRDLTYAKLDELLVHCRDFGLAGDPEYHVLQGIAERRYFYDPIVKIEDGHTQVMDLEVDDSDHSFVGNGLVNHNTVEAIAALCYLWEKDPDRKVLVVTNKSPVGQWCDEFAKFCKPGKIKVIRNDGPPLERQAAYQTWERSTGPTVMVMGYATCRQDFSHIQEWKDYIVIFDECFDYQTPVQLADGTKKRIGTIVTHKMDVEVLSRNPETGQIEPKRVVNWFRRPVPGRNAERPWDSKKGMLKINFRFSGKMWVTPNHEVYTPEGKVKASNLRKGAQTLHLTRNCPTDPQWQVVLGSLLGDGSISSPEHDTWGFSFGHCEEQRPLLAWKRNMVETLGASEIAEDVNTGYRKKDGDKRYYRFRMRANEALTSFLVQSSVRHRKKKRVTPEWLDRIGPLGLAVWYADDGSISTHTTRDGRARHIITFSSNDFSREENGILAGWLRWKWGVNAQVKTSRRRSDRSEGAVKTFPYLYLSPDAADRFLSLLPGALPGVEYKFPNKQLLVPADFDLVPTAALVVDWVKTSKPWKPQPNFRYVYDIEVEDNHNYFANGTLVSNCQAFKNPKTQIHQVCKHMSAQAARCWCLTATLIRNNLSEGYGIYEVMLAGTGIRLFPGNLTAFLNEYYVMRLQRVGKKGRMIPLPVYLKQGSVEKFRLLIEPFYLGRPKHEVARELPPLTIRVERVGLTPAQKEKYNEALAGLLEIDMTGEVKETTVLTALIYCQEIVDHPELIECEGGSKKLDRLMEILTEGTFAEENVIVYSRFEKMASLLERAFKKAKIPCTRITGKETKKVEYKGRKVSERDRAMGKFNDPKDPTRVCLITDAGSESINLQSAKLLIFYDTPWSGGNFIQTLGRMIRIGSQHDRVYAMHLAAKGSIDEKVLGVLKKKMGLIEAVMGKRIKGEDDKGIEVDDQNDIAALFRDMAKDARKQLQKTS